jgi:Ca2+-binding RTX toxin-like protein
LEEILAVINGTEKRDLNLDGSPEDDNIAGLAGNDWIHGMSGNDLISGGKDADRIWGGGDNTLAPDGNDTIYGGRGNDEIKGGEGDDLLYGGRGDDGIWGDGGNDYLVGGPGFNLLYGGEGIDTLIGNSGDGFSDTQNSSSNSDVFIINVAPSFEQNPRFGEPPRVIPGQLNDCYPGVDTLIIRLSQGQSFERVILSQISGAFGYNFFQDGQLISGLSVHHNYRDFDNHPPIIEYI